MGDFIQQNLNPVRLITDTLSKNKGTAETIGGMVEKAVPSVIGYLAGGPVGAGIGAGLHDWARTGDLTSGLKSGAISGATSYLGGKAFDALGGAAASGANAGAATDLGSSRMALSPFEINPALDPAKQAFSTSYLDRLMAGPLPSTEYVPLSMSIEEGTQWGTVGNNFTSPWGTKEARPWWGTLGAGGGISGDVPGGYLYSAGGGVGTVAPAASGGTYIDVTPSGEVTPGTTELGGEGGGGMFGTGNEWLVDMMNNPAAFSPMPPTTWDNVLSAGSDVIGLMKEYPKTSLFTTGILSNLLSSGQKKQREDEYRKALLDQMTNYQNEFRAGQAEGQWDDAKRANYMKGIMGNISSAIEGQKRRIAANQAALGRGGGSYNQILADALQKGREQAAQSYAQTYVPKAVLAPDASSYKSIAEAMMPSAGALESTAGGIAGTTGSILPYMYMLELLGRK